MKKYTTFLIISIVILQVSLFAQNDGLEIENASTHGLRILDAGSNAIQIDNSTFDGVHILTSGRDGIRVNNTIQRGIRMENIGLHGLHILDAGSNAIQIDNSTDDGLHILASGRDGARISNTVDNGIVVGNTGNHGVWIGSTGGHGILVAGATGDAGHFDGDVTVTGTLSKGGGSFKIDHPLEPTRKYLSHSFVESPDMMNVYNGNVRLDKKGEAVIVLPDYFDALNKDYRYQLTCVGGFAKVYVSEKIKNNRFKIEGGKPGMEVSWQVTGVRDDPWARANRIKVEEDKAGSEQGSYLHPQAYDYRSTAKEWNSPRH